MLINRFKPSALLMVQAMLFG